MAIIKVNFCGKKYSYQEVFISSFEEALQIAGENCIADLYPSIRVVLEMMSRDKTKLKELYKISDKLLQDIIDDHRNRKSGKCKEEEGSEDLVDVLLKFQQKDSEYLLTDDNIKAVIQVSLIKTIIIISLIVFCEPKQVTCSKNFASIYFLKFLQYKSDHKALDLIMKSCDSYLVLF
ncbi:hypothetical protein HN51_023674 [Arachis hypogaea]